MENQRVFRLVPILYGFEIHEVICQSIIITYQHLSYKDETRGRVIAVAR